ncbi:MAG: hypothetical protein KGM15_03945 [Pseudomonadota bacterium]|nr:hypothetical protein [Pseudomonadota bacterium]
MKARLVQLYYGAPTLFGQTARKRAKVLPVGNQPGYAIVNISGESFLVSAPLAGLPMLDQSLTLTRPYAVIKADSFVCTISTAPPRRRSSPACSSLEASSAIMGSSISRQRPRSQLTSIRKS